MAIEFVQPTSTIGRLNFLSQQLVAGLKILWHLKFESSGWLKNIISHLYFFIGEKDFQEGATLLIGISGVGGCVGWRPPMGGGEIVHFSRWWVGIGPVFVV